MKLLFALALGLQLSSTAFANTHVKCGKQADLDNAPDVIGYELELSSEGVDDYSGAVGGSWNLKLHSEDSEWLAPNPAITAKNYKSGDQVIVEITIEQGRSSSGPVGTKYRLVDLYSDEPKLEKYTMGGFAGTLLLGTLQCFSGND